MKGRLIAAVLSGNIRGGVVTGIAIAVVSMLLFATIHSAVRNLSDTMSPFQIVFWRMSISIVLLMPWYVWKGFHLLRTSRPLMHLQRAVVNFGGMILWFGAIAVVPLGKAVAIHFTLPLFILLLAWLFLGERVGGRRIAATLVGFAGMLIILRPGVAAFGWPEAMILGSAVLYAATVIYLKTMVDTETPLALTFYTNCLVGLFSVPFAMVFWVTPTWNDLMPILVLGILGTLAPFLYTTALKAADASIIAPIDFLRLPFTAGLAFLLFSEVPDVWIWPGAAIIVLSTTYITMRERAIRKRLKEEKDR